MPTLLIHSYFCKYIIFFCLLVCDLLFCAYCSSGLYEYSLPKVEKENEADNNAENMDHCPIIKSSLEYKGNHNLPSANEIEALTFYDISISDNKLQCILETYQQLETIGFSKVNFKFSDDTLPSNVFSKLNELKKLKQLWFNGINSISDWNFINDGCSSTLERLRLKNCEHFHLSNLNNCNNLVYLDVSYNNLSNTHNTNNIDSLENIPLESLKYLNLEHTEIRSITNLTEQCNSSCPLQELYLKGNNFENFNPDNVMKLNNLRVLHAPNYGQCTTINASLDSLFDAISTDLVHLEDLNVCGRNWRNGNGDIVIPASIKKLNLSNTKIGSSSLQELSFQSECNIEYLDLSDNGLTSLDFIDNCSNIKYLDLSHNSLERITTTHLSHLSNIEYLDLSYNSICLVEIEDENNNTNMPYLSHLRLLNLSRNQLSTLDISFFVSQTPQLEVLDICCHHIITTESNQTPDPRIHNDNYSFENLTVNPSLRLLVISDITRYANSYFNFFLRVPHCHISTCSYDCGNDNQVDCQGD